MTASSKPLKHKDFADRLVSWRKHFGFSQATGSAELDVIKRTLQEWEQRRRKPLLASIEHVLARLQKDGF
jgi:DNA-binding transcriptional regulator YiaG